MKRCDLRSASIFMFILMICGAANSQSANIEASLSDFKSPDQQLREDAYYAIRDNSDALRQLNVKKALIELMMRENHAYNDPKASYGEGYIEYVSDLGETVGTFADWHDSELVCLLADNPAYSDNGGHITGLAEDMVKRAGNLALPCFFKMAAGGTEVERDSAITMLLKISATRSDVSQPNQQKIFEVVVASLRDSDPGLRLSTVLASELLGTPKLIPLLQELATSDPYQMPEAHFPIRDAARKAIESIEGREKSQ